MKTQTARYPLPATEFTFAGFRFPRYVGMLKTGPLTKRLKKAKESFCGPYYHTPTPVTADANARSFYLESDFAPGMRWTWCDEVEGVRIDHTGWFTDDEGTGDKIRGLVMRLPHGHGFLAGWSMGESMASVIETDVYDSETDAAHAADSIAENAAEKEREYQAAQNAETDDSDDE
jgi:hypothetical protein